MATSLLKRVHPGKPRTLLGLTTLQRAVLKTSSEALQTQASLLHEYTDPQNTPYAVVNSKVIDFNDPQTVFAAKSTARLLQSFAILKACQFKPLVQNAQSLLGLSTAVLGRTATTKIVEKTFFQHFCAGTNAETIAPTLAYLRQNGILPILNYAAEDDVTAAPEHAADADSAAEAALQRQANVFMRSIVDCDNSQPARGFVGIKLTGLGRAEVLERMSSILAEAGPEVDRGHSSACLQELMAARLSPEEHQSFQNLYRRLNTLSAAVHQKGNMRMLIDAEQSYLQPAIDALTIAMQQMYNRDAAVIMNTYQCYLKDSAERIDTDLKRASREGWVWGAKTVRGAYMHIERARAVELGVQCPIHDSLSATHHNYNACVESVMERVARGHAELMVASHNQASIEAALDNMRHMGVPADAPGSGLYFGQLLGMADHLTLPLGSRGYNVYKICAYGSVAETTAFLLRRAVENSDMLGGCAREVDLIRAELGRRLSPRGQPSAVWRPADAGMHPGPAVA